MTVVAVYDFLSHEFMHHPFNESYLRLVAQAFPEAEVVFHAREGHLDRLKPNLSDISRITYRACEPFAVPFGLSRHNPLGGRLAARRCLSQIRASVGARPLQLAAILGVDANLLATMKSQWSALFSAPLHMILHNHLAESVQWRSRNPLFRLFDFRSTLVKPFAKGQHLIVLELGIKEAVSDLAPGIASNIETLEHPILESEWLPRKEPSDPIRIGFLGHASIHKGFGHFLEFARKSDGGMVFDAIGIASAAVLKLDLGPLARAPSPGSVPRAEYVAALRELDAVCLPLPRDYDYVASGSVIDAIAGLKPLFCLSNRSIEGIVEKYGPIGHIAGTMEELEDFVLHRSREALRLHWQEWTANLARIRTARSPEALAPEYARLARA